MYEIAKHQLLKKHSSKVLINYACESPLMVFSTCFVGSNEESSAPDGLEFFRQQEFIGVCLVLTIIKFENPWLVRDNSNGMSLRRSVANLRSFCKRQSSQLFVIL